MKKHFQLVALMAPLVLFAPEALAQGPASVFTYQSAELPGGIVAQSGDTIVLAASGGVRIMTRNLGVWSEQAFLATPYDAGDSFGAAVALEGDTLAIGAPLEDSGATGVGGDPLDNTASNSGAVFIYARQAGAWSQQAYLKASNTSALDEFGSSVALHASTLVVGSAHEASLATGLNGDQTDNSSIDAGAAYVFERTASVWSQTDYVKASNAEAGDSFGSALAISGDTFVVTAPFEDSQFPGVGGFEGANGKLNSGAAYVFARTGGAWTQEAYVKASNPSKKDLFGMFVAIDGDLMAVSTVHEGSAATGIDGDQLDESAPDSGAAYAFQRDASGWAQTAYLKASNTEAVDRFGSALAVSGNRVLVVADSEQGGSAGLDSQFQQGNGFFTPSRKGAAYMFEVNGAGWSQTHFIKGSHGISAFDAPVCSAQAGEFTAGPFVFDEAATVGMRRYGPATGANKYDLYILGTPAAGETVLVEIAHSPGFFNADLVFLMASAAPAVFPGVLNGTILFDPALSFSGLSPLVLLPPSDWSGKLSTSLTLPSGVQGLTAYCQIFFLGSEFTGGLEMTTGLAMTVGP